MMPTSLPGVSAYPIAESILRRSGRRGIPVAGGMLYPQSAYLQARGLVERVRALYATGRFLFPSVWDSYTNETPDIRQRYLSMLAEPMVKAAFLKKIASVVAQDCSVIPADPDGERDVLAAKAFRQVLGLVGTAIPGVKSVRSTGPKLIAEEILIGKGIMGWSLSELVDGPGLDRKSVV